MNLPVVGKWSRFERSFKSSRAYGNALQEASLTVRFTSPAGEVTEVPGFWDGGKIWRVRFSPDQPGRWTFSTACSDRPNRGLDNQTGEFICTAATGTNRFRAHGPIRVALDHLHFEHADGTPFFWLADTVWNGPCLSESKDWDLYARVRAGQGFSVALWSAVPGREAHKQRAFSGSPERIAVDPDFFKRLDARLERLSQAGILSAVSPFLDGPPLPEEQAILLARYIVARWQAEPAAWLIAFDPLTSSEAADDWKKIGQSLFGRSKHAPVILYAGQTSSLIANFRDQAWVDAFGFQVTTDVAEDALRKTFARPLTEEWMKAPVRPMIAFTPHENGFWPKAAKRFTSDEVRHAAYWGLLLAPPAGVTYGGQGVANWDTASESPADKTRAAGLPFWQKALFMPAAKEMSLLARFLQPTEWWRLRPQSKIVSLQPGDTSPNRQILAAQTDGEARDLTFVYVPEDRTIELTTATFPVSPTITWFNPRTGQYHPAVAVVGERVCQFPTPDPGDWVLVMKGAK